MYRNHCRAKAIHTAAIIFGFLLVMVLSAVANAQSKNEIETLIRVSAEAHGVDANLAVAIATVESGLNPKAIGALGEVGVFQLRPEYHAVKRGDTQANVETAMKYMVQLQSLCSKYAEAFFICWNVGPHAREFRYPKKFAYYRKVMEVKKKLEARTLALSSN